MLKCLLSPNVACKRVMLRNVLRPGCHMMLSTNCMCRDRPGRTVSKHGTVQVLFKR
jgi:hypothetical protein